MSYCKGPSMKMAGYKSTHCEVLPPLWQKSNSLSLRCERGLWQQLNALTQENVIVNTGKENQTAHINLGFLRTWTSNFIRGISKGVITSHVFSRYKFLGSVLEILNLNFLSDEFRQLQLITDNEVLPVFIYPFNKTSCTGVPSLPTKILSTERKQKE